MLRRAKLGLNTGKRGGASADAGFVLPDTGNLARVYSLRQYDGYSGFCIRVVRATDSATLDVGFVDGVVDATAIASFCAGTTGKVDRWYDQSGTGTFAFQATDGRRPFIYESGAIVTYGGVTSLRWPAASDLGIGSTIDCQSSFAVYKITSIQGLNTILFGSSTAQMWAGGTAIGGVNGVTIWTGSVRVTNTSENTNYNLSSWFGGSDDKVDTNASDEATAGSEIGAFNISNISRGDGNFSINGYMHEVILYTASQYANKSTIENMINDYYSIY